MKFHQVSVGRLERQQGGPCAVCEPVAFAWTDGNTEPPDPAPCPVCARRPVLIVMGYDFDGDAGRRVHPAE